LLHCGTCPRALDERQPRYSLNGEPRARQNPQRAARRERVALGSVERLYRDFATG
jgi:hypothetical protein